MTRLLFTLSLLAACGPDVSITKQRVDADGDGYTEDVDCDDAQAQVNPSAAEMCDGRDNDCDEAVDEDAADAVTWFSDVDGDGFGDPDAPIVACADPADAVADATDCDDAVSAAFPGNPERCDGVDNDCNGAVDDDPSDLTTFYVDGDGDGYGDPSTAMEACEAGSDEVTNGTDCDDDDSAVHPDADELDCTDPTDYNCDGSVGYADTDGDGVPACEDCDDSDASRAPTATEVCDEADVDEDCDGASDDDDAGVSGAPTWYRDLDGDGYSTGSGTSVTQCEAPVGYAATTGDCDDYDSGANPGAAEVCDAADTDEDCDGDADDADASTDASTWTTWNRDADEDGYGDVARTVAQCESPTGYVGNDDDCDDTTATVSPGATEVCDAVDVDEDCDGLIDDDDGSVTGETTWYRDADGDGYAGASTTTACTAPAGYLSTSTDCNDAVATISPAATEVCDTANVDEDCDGLADDNDASATGETTWYRDADTDGYGGTSATSACDVPSGYVATSTDCNDAVATISPAATEVCDTENVDEDCDGLADDNDASATGETTWYRDADADGYGGTTTTSTCDVPSGYVATSTDCNDAVATISPAAAEVCDAANVDEDCDGLADDNDASAIGETTWYRDADSDGYGGTTTTSTCDLPSGYVSTSTDCNDAVATISPAATEICDASDIDEDCDGLADDADTSTAGKTTWYRDADVDGYGGTTATSTCDLPSGYVATSTDCNDAVTTISPAAAEVCDTIDNDCDALVDDDDPGVTGASTWYADLDLDGFGDPDDSVLACEEPIAYTDDATDCDDTDADANPLGTELYGNTVDEDCDGDTDPFTISCSGASVPGTYATLTAALAASAPVICLAEGTYTGNYTLTGDAEIIGAGQGRTVLTGSLSANDQELLLSHVTVEDGITEPGGSSILQHVTATCTTTSYAIYFIMVAGEDILLDSVDASCTSGYAIYAQVPASNISEVWLTVQNSWLHDSNNGLYAGLGGSSTSKHPYLYALNNTVTNNYYGLREVTYGATNGRARFYNANNVVYGNTFGIYQSFPISGSSVDYSNALYDNGDDYANEADPGVFDITADPLLDFAYEPPIPGAGSPLIDAGTTYYYADLDYWETTRSTTTPTIGAVER